MTVFRDKFVRTRERCGVAAVGSLMCATYYMLHDFLHRVKIGHVYTHREHVAELVDSSYMDNFRGTVASLTHL